jgi:hypothetical protein
MEINITTSVWPGWTSFRALEYIHTQSTYEPIIGNLSTKYIQICPQNPGFIDVESANFLKEKYKNSNLRLHANARVDKDKKMKFYCAPDGMVPDAIKYFNSLAEINGVFGTDAYSMHAGEQRIPWEKWIDSIKKLTDLFLKYNVRLAVEGMYPANKGRYDLYFLNNWDGWKKFFEETDFFYAVDLSHMQIIAKYKGWDWTFLKELIKNKRCLEVHISENNGIADEHKTLDKKPVWWKMMKHINPQTVIFSEGDQSRATHTPPPPQINY